MLKISLVDLKGIVSRDQVVGTELCVEFWYQIPVSYFYLHFTWFNPFLKGVKKIL